MQKNIRDMASNGTVADGSPLAYHNRGGDVALHREGVWNNKLYTRENCHNLRIMLPCYRDWRGLQRWDPWVYWSVGFHKTGQRPEEDYFRKAARQGAFRNESVSERKSDGKGRPDEGQIRVSWVSWRWFYQMVYELIRRALVIYRPPSELWEDHFDLCCFGKYAGDDAERRKAGLGPWQEQDLREKEDQSCSWAMFECKREEVPGYRRYLLTMYVARRTKFARKIISEHGEQAVSTAVLRGIDASEGRMSQTEVEVSRQAAEDIARVIV